MLVLLLADETRMSGRADAVSARRFGRSFALLLQTVVLALVTQRTTANAAVTFAAVQRAARLSHTSIADAQRMRLGQNALVIQWPRIGGYRSHGNFGTKIQNVFFSARLAACTLQSRLCVTRSTHLSVTLAQAPPTSFPPPPPPPPPPRENIFDLCSSGLYFPEPSVGELWPPSFHKRIICESHRLPWQPLKGRWPEFLTLFPPSAAVRKFAGRGSFRRCLAPFRVKRNKKKKVARRSTFVWTLTEYQKKLKRKGRRFRVICWITRIPMQWKWISPGKWTSSGLVSHWANCYNYQKSMCSSNNSSNLNLN